MIEPRRKTAGANVYMLQPRADYVDWLAGMDVFLSPVMKGIAPPLGTLFDPEIGFEEMFDRVASFASYTAVQNAVGMPGVSVPVGLSDGGLAVGCHFVAPTG